MDHTHHHASDFLKKFWVTLACTLPILAYPDVVGVALGSVVFFYGGFPFLNGAYRELRTRLPGMMTLIALAISAAYAWSVYAAFAGQEALWWELSTLIVIMLLGHWIEMKAVASASGALKELAKLLPDMAEVVRGGKESLVPLSELREGDTVLVKPGAKIPADGKIIEGKSDLNESIITGESKLVPKGAGDEVIAGSLNGDGSLKITVSKIGERTFLAGVMRLVKEAEASKSRLQLLSDRAALWLTIIAVVAGATTLVSWLWAGAGVAFSVERLVAVLVVACPHALGLAVPLVAAISTTMAAKSGFLVKRRLAPPAPPDNRVLLFF